MKGKKWVTPLVAAALAFLMSFGAVGCMITGFELNIESMGSVVLVCGAFSLCCAAAFRLKRGGTLILCILAPLSGYLWHRDQAVEQVFQLLYRITRAYDKAYGCGVLKLVDTPWNAGAADIPMGIIGGLVAIAVTRSVCRGKGAVLPAAAALLPLVSCLVVTDTVPAEGYLFILLLGLFLLILTSRVRKNNPSQGNRLTVMAALPTALALTALFLAVPQEGYVNQSEEIREEILAWVEDFPQSLETAAQNIAVSVQNGEPESVNLATLGRRVESTIPVMEVTADVGGTLYLRGQDYDLYDGAGWEATPHRVEELSYAGVDLGNVTIQTRNRLDQLYLPYYPADSTSLVGGRIDNTRLDTQYSFSRTGLPDGWQEAEPEGSEEVSDLLLSGEESEEIQSRQRYLVLPNATRREAEALLETILSGEETAAKKAEKIAGFVRNSARYDLNTSRMPSGGEDFALWFLEESETGYCVHFATAAVVLLRAADIEARYVSGYMVRTRAGQTVTVTVTGENAHAWAEYYEPALDTWVVLEATPADLSEEPEASPATEEATMPSEEPQTQPTEPAYTISEEPMAPAGADAPEKREMPGWLGGLVKALLLTAAAVFGITFQRSARIRLRRKRQRTGSPNAQALARWREAERLAKLLKEPPSEELESLAQKAKFSQHNLTAEELTRFESYLRTARQQLREKPWFLQPVYQYVFALY